MSGPGLPRLVLAGFGWFALFALIYFAGAALGAWPEAPVGGFRGVDLAAGLVFGLVLLAALLFPRGRGRGR